MTDEKDFLRRSAEVMDKRDLDRAGRGLRKKRKPNRPPVETVRGVRVDRLRRGSL